MNKIIIGLTVLVFVGIIVLGGATNKTAPQTSQMTQTGTVLWQPEIAHLKDRLAAIGLPALKEEGTVLHIHQHLDIYVHGKQVAVPPGIGINEAAGFISPIHVHDTDSIIHVESPTVQTFTLGQFFDVWGVTFNRNMIADNIADASSTLQVFVNGKKVAGDPRNVALAAHQEIVVIFGSAEEMPVVPKSFIFSGTL